MKTNRLGHRAAEVAGQPAIAHLLVSAIDAGVRDAPGHSMQQVADVVQQGGDDERVGRIGAFGQRRRLQRMFQLGDRLAEV